MSKRHGDSGENRETEPLFFTAPYAQHTAETQQGGEVHQWQYGSFSLAKQTLSGTWAFQSCGGPSGNTPVLIEVKPPTGDPDAGNPPVRFGGRGDANQCIVPTPIMGERGNDNLRPHADKFKGLIPYPLQREI
jgi:hypothetical protein